MGRGIMLHFLKVWGKGYGMRGCDQVLVEEAGDDGH